VTTVVNTHQAQAWNGYEGQHWANEYERYNRANDGMNQPLLITAAITETDRVLDIGCGTGHTTRLAARLASHGHATGIDLSGPMLTRARDLAAAEGVGNVTFQQGDAQVYPLPDNGFDVAISRGGVMFFGDPVAAFGNINRALRPAGRLAFVGPKDNSISGDFARALAPLWHLISQHTTRSTPPGPTWLASPDRIAEVLDTAGFTDISSTPITVGMVFGDNAVDAAEFLFVMGPMRFNLAGVAQTDIDRTKAEVIDCLRPYEQPDGVRLTAEMWLVHALAGAR
jgi:ubiquinone/menaquinone biosynthesis C-methylase UbiE